MRPSVGRLVHYVNLGDKDGKYPPQVQAAVITGIYQELSDGTIELVNDGIGSPEANISDLVDLKVLYRTGLFDCQKMPKRTSPDQRGCWDWPVKI